MIITSQGFGHYTHGINNQDFGMENDKKNMLLILDGCSQATYAESGTRLFAQLFSRKEEWDNLEKFEDNVTDVFDHLIEMLKNYYPTQESLEKDFIMENLLFTIIACFETEDAYIVKLFGDGYIITQNKKGLISYIKFSYGKCPPYFAYRYCPLSAPSFAGYQFKTFVFDKAVFQKVAIATDGVMPIAKGNNKGLDFDIVNGNTTLVEMEIKKRKMSFFDDVTIGMFGGKTNGNSKQAEKVEEEKMDNGKRTTEEGKRDIKSGISTFFSARGGDSRSSNSGTTKKDS